MSDQSSRKKPNHAGGGFASAAVKHELERLAQAAASSAGLAGSGAVGSPLDAENVVRAVLGKPPGSAKQESLAGENKRRSVHDWSLATPPR